MLLIQLIQLIGPFLFISSIFTGACSEAVLAVQRVKLSLEAAYGAYAAVPAPTTSLAPCRMMILSIRATATPSASSERQPQRTSLALPKPSPLKLPYQPRLLLETADAIIIGKYYSLMHPIPHTHSNSR